MPLRTGSRRRAVVPAATVVALGAFTVAAPAAHAADTGVPCDAAALVQAVADANTTTTPDVLSLAPDCVYTLTAPAVPGGDTGLPDIEGTLTIDGNQATIMRAPDAPQFRIISNWGDLTLDAVTITGGHAPDGVGTDFFGDGNSGKSGGGIQNWGPLTITNSVISGNTAGAGAPGADATATAWAGRGGSGGFGGGISSYALTTVPMTITDTVITGNTSGAAAPGGNGTGTRPGGRGGTGGFGGGVSLTSGTDLHMTGSTITGNATAPGAPGGTGGPDGGGGGDGGSGGSGAGLFVSTSQGEQLNPIITGSAITDNVAGRGGDTGAAGPGGYEGWAGFGGNGGGLSVFYDTLTLDGGTVSDNLAGGPGAGYLPLPANAGGIYTLDAHVTLTNGATVTGNKPNNCYSVADVPGCVNETAIAQRSAGAPVRARQVEDLARAVSSTRG